MRFLTLIGCLAVAVEAPTSPATAAPAVDAQTSSLDAWRPRGKSIAVNVGQAAGPTGTAATLLHVSGRIDSDWNYACSSGMPIRPGQLYRVSFWLRVERLGPTTPPPYLKCETHDEQRREIHQAQTEAYDAAQLGKWQQLAGEFRASASASQCWFALEKGTRQTAEIDAWLTEVRIEPIARLGYFERYRLKPSQRTDKLSAAHPRLYLDTQRIAALRKAIGGSHAAMWKDLSQRADVAAKRGPPAYKLDDGHSGDEQLWQRDVGNTLPVLAMAYALSGKREYLEAAERWSTASCGYPTWGLKRYDGMDLATGHQLFGLALVYDWCYHDLSLATRDTIRQTLVRRGAALFEATAEGRAGWHRSYLQNHLWVNITGLAAAGLTLDDELEDASSWVGLALDKYRRTMEALGPDGASHEGVGYWQYGVEYMLKFMDLAETHLATDLHNLPWWQHTAAYAQYLAIPRRAWHSNQTIVDLADCPRGHWYGPDYLLRRLAAKYRDGHAQWLADETGQAHVSAPGAPWLNLVWYDPSVPAAPPAKLPTMHHFADMEIVSARSNWSGDESLVVFKCGPYIGHDAIRRFTYDPGGGHVHPDAGHFVIFGHGEWLLRDDGYHPKRTALHNTLMIDGRGQLGEGSEWFRGAEALTAKAEPKVLCATSSPGLDQISGDATQAYPAELGLKRFVRHLLYLKPNILLVIDDVQTERRARLELCFHPEQSPRREGRALLAQGKQAVLRIDPLTTEGVSIGTDPAPLPGRKGRGGSTIEAVTLARQANRWQNAVAFSWSASDSAPPVVEGSAASGTWSFTTGKQRVTFNWTTGKAAIAP